jgi:hypothetical protein
MNYPCERDRKGRSDNGFRNMALKNFLPSPNHTDLGVLNENFTYEERIFDPILAD